MLKKNIKKFKNFLLILLVMVVETVEYLVIIKNKIKQITLLWVRRQNKNVQTYFNNENVYFWDETLISDFKAEVMDWLNFFKKIIIFVYKILIKLPPKIKSFVSHCTLYNIFKILIYIIIFILEGFRKSTKLSFLLYKSRRALKTLPQIPLTIMSLLIKWSYKYVVNFIINYYKTKKTFVCLPEAFFSFKKTFNLTLVNIQYEIIHNYKTFFNDYVYVNNYINTKVDKIYKVAYNLWEEFKSLNNFYILAVKGVYTYLNFINFNLQNRITFKLFYCVESNFFGKDFDYTIFAKEMITFIKNIFFIENLFILLFSRKTFWKVSTEGIQLKLKKIKEPKFSIYNVRKTDLILKKKNFIFSKEGNKNTRFFTKPIYFFKQPQDSVYFIRKSNVFSKTEFSFVRQECKSIVLLVLSFNIFIFFWSYLTYCGLTLQFKYILVIPCAYVFYNRALLFNGLQISSLFLKKIFFILFKTRY